MSVLQVITKAATADPDAARELVRFGLYEALCDEVDRIRPAAERQLAAAIAKSTVDGRRALVRSFIARRLAAGDVDDVLKAAAGLTAVEVAVAKADRPDFTPDDPATPWWDARDARGEFASGRLRRGVVDLLGTATRRDPDLEQKAKATAGMLTGDRYDRMHALGNLLVASGQPHAQAVGTVARLAGEIGPQAEQVLGPGLKRTAYRYRGTERRPDAGTQQATRRIARSVDLLGREQGQRLSDDEILALRRAGEAFNAPADRAGGRAPGLPPEDGVLGYWLKHGKGQPPDYVRLAATGDYAAAKLLRNVPDVHTARISLEAGKLPPSVGMIIDKDGDLVTEAMGFNGDHYLPFDLKNLKRLHGGSYVRTRTTGGPTDEDIYTALMTGARQVTVVSNSGVFSIEFDPALRGGRRYSDKARQMVDRYARLTAAIGSGQLMQRPFSVEQRAEMQREALRLAGNDPRKVREFLPDIEARERARLAMADDTDYSAEATAAADTAWRMGQKGNKPTTSRQTHAQDVADTTRELKAQTDAQAARAYRLDGEGYKAALHALAQEFPYFIRDVRVETLPEFTASRRLTLGRRPADRLADIGYTERRGLSPRAAGNLGAPVKRPSARSAGEDKSTDKTGDKATDKTPDTGADTAAAKPVDYSAMLASSPIADDLAAALGASLAGRARVNPGLAPAATNEDEALGEPAGAYGTWLINTHRSMKPLAQWLLNPKTDVRHLDKVRTELDALQMDMPDDVAPLYPGFDKAREMLDTVSAVREPFAPEPGKGVDLALQGSDPNQPRPQPFPDIVNAAGDFGALHAYYVAHPEVAEEVRALRGQDDQQISEHLSQQVMRYKKLEAWGKEGAPLGQPGVTPTGFGEAEAKEAQEIAAMGTNSPAYHELANQQRAWTFLRASRTLARVKGVEEPTFEEGEGRPKELTKRARRTTVVLHPPGSPRAQELAKRLASARRAPAPASRSPRPARAASTR